MFAACPGRAGGLLALTPRSRKANALIASGGKPIDGTFRTSVIA